MESEIVKTKQLRKDILNDYDLSVNTKDVIRKYVKVFKYPSNLQ